MVESTCFQHTSSHPDKHNNSVDRIILKKRRDKIQGENFNLSLSTVVFPQIIQELQCFHTQSSKFPVIPCYSTYRINSSPRNTTTTRLIPCRLLPATVPRVSKHSTRQNKAPGLPYSIPGPYSTSRLPVILPGRNSTLSSSQHPRSPYSSSQAHSYKNSTRRNRILSKGLSIVYPIQY